MILINIQTNNLTNIKPNTNTLIPTSTKSQRSFNFFNTSNKSRTNMNQNNDNISLINKNNNVEVKQYNYQLNKYESFNVLNAYKRTNQEKNLIPHPKAKTLGYTNPFISQIKIK